MYKLLNIRLVTVTIIIIFITLYSIYFIQHAASKTSSKKNLTIDIEIIEGALLAEKEIVEAYKICIKKNILSKETISLFKKILNNNLAQIYELKNLLKTKLEKENDQLDYDFPIEELKSEKDAIKFVADLESSLISSYIDALEITNNQDLKKYIGKTISTDSMNWAILLSKIEKK